MGGPFIEIRITHPWELIQPTPEALRPRLLDWQVDAKGRHVAWRYRITRYEQDGEPRWWLDGTGQHPWTSDDVEYLKDVAEHHAESTAAQTAMAAQERVQRPGAAAVARWWRVVLVRWLADAYGTPCVSARTPSPGYWTPMSHVRLRTLEPLRFLPIRGGRCGRR
jgi:hypothetical protein